MAAKLKLMTLLRNTAYGTHIRIKGEYSGELYYEGLTKYIFDGRGVDEDLPEKFGKIYGEYTVENISVDKNGTMVIGVILFVK